MAKETNQDNAQNNTQTENGNNTNAGRIGTSITPEGEMTANVLLEALLRDTLVEELPLQPLCKPDCKGLCSQCGIDLNENPDHQHDMTDIRFAALEGLKAKLEGKE